MSAINTDSKPLTDREKALVERLLSDPFSYPRVFRSWHVRSLETSDLALSMTNVLGLTSTLGLDPGSTGTLSLLNTGSLMLYAGTDLPDGALVCDGAVYDKSVYPELFDVIGYSFGGAGANFQVPNVVAPGVGLKYVIVT